MENVHLSLFRSAAIGSFKEKRMVCQNAGPSEVQQQAESIKERMKSPAHTTDVLEKAVQDLEKRGGEGYAAALVLVDLINTRKENDKELSDSKKSTEDQRKNIGDKMKDATKDAAIVDAKKELESAIKKIQEISKEEGGAYTGKHTRLQLLDVYKTHVEELVKLTKEKGGVQLFAKTEFQKEDPKSDEQKKSLGVAYLASEGFAPGGTPAEPELTKKFGAAENTIDVTYSFMGGMWRIETEGGPESGDAALDKPESGYSDKVIIDNPKFSDQMNAINAITQNLFLGVQDIPGDKTIRNAVIDKANTGVKQVVEALALTKSHDEVFRESLERDAQKLDRAKLKTTKENIKNEIREKTDLRRKEIWNRMEEVSKMDPRPYNYVEHIAMLRKQLEEIRAVMYEALGEKADKSAEANKGDGKDAEKKPETPVELSADAKTFAENALKDDAMQKILTALATNKNVRQEFDVLSRTPAFEKLTPAEKTEIAKRMTAKLRELDAKQGNKVASKEITIDKDGKFVAAEVSTASAGKSADKDPSGVKPGKEGGAETKLPKNFLEMVQEIVKALLKELLPVLKELRASNEKNTAEIQKQTALLMQQMEAIKKIPVGVPTVPFKPMYTRPSMPQMPYNSGTKEVVYTKVDIDTMRLGTQKEIDALKARQDKVEAEVQTLKYKVDNVNTKLQTEGLRVRMVQKTDGYGLMTNAVEAPAIIEALRKAGCDTSKLPVVVNNGGTVTINVNTDNRVSVQQNSSRVDVANSPGSTVVTGQKQIKFDAAPSPTTGSRRIKFIDPLPSGDLPKAKK